MRSLIRINSILSLLFISLLASQTNATEVMDIVKKAIHVSYYQGEDAKARVDMRIIDRQGRERTRSMIILRKNTSKNDSTQKYYVFFKSPSDIKKTVFMAWKNSDHDDDRWLYLPALDLVKRIAASDERTSFVGSHFFYEDVSGRGIDEDAHELVEESDKYYVIKSTPKHPELVEFIHFKNWVDKKTFLPMKAEYFNTNNVLYRTYTIKKVSIIDSYPTVIDVQMEDNLTGGKTILNYSAIKYTLGLPEDIFSERYLRRPAKKYLR
jgi:outer membrane lipoprotein-sorting protein